MITTFYPPHTFGGDGFFVASLASELARAGHEVEVVYCADSYRALGGAKPDLKTEHIEGVTVHRLKSHLGILSPIATQQSGYPWFKGRRLREVLSRGFEVIHFHNISLIGGPAILRYGEGIKLYTAHEYWLSCPTHLLWKWKRSPCTKKHCLACTLVHGRPPQWWRYTPLLRSSIKHLDAVIAPSEFSRAIHAKLDLGVPIHHLPNFVPAGHTVVNADVAPARPSDRPYFLFVGRLEHSKGLQSAIGLFRDLSAADMLIAGEGNYQRHLQGLASGMSNVHFLGRLPHEQLSPLYKSAVAVVVPSLWYEVCPLVILEAFMHGTPVLARDLGSMKELIEQSGAGRVFRTSAELLVEMKNLVEQPALRKRLGMIAQHAYHSRYTAEAHMRGYFDLLNNLESNKKNMG